VACQHKSMWRSSIARYVLVRVYSSARAAFVVVTTTLSLISSVQQPFARTATVPNGEGGRGAATAFWRRVNGWTRLSSGWAW